MYIVLHYTKFCLTFAKYFSLLLYFGVLLLYFTIFLVFFCSILLYLCYFTLSWFHSALLCLILGHRLDYLVPFTSFTVSCYSILFNVCPILALYYPFTVPFCLIWCILLLYFSIFGSINPLYYHHMGSIRLRLCTLWAKSVAVPVLYGPHGQNQYHSLYPMGYSVVYSVSFPVPYGL
jgi:hypothetical protein